MAVKGKIVAMFDMNEDGEVNLRDMTHIIVRHEWMFLAGLFIFIGALGNVFGYSNINSDAYWAAAGLAAMLEYVDDTRRIRKVKRDEEGKK